MDPANLLDHLIRIAGSAPPASPPSPPLNNGGGGGNFPDMEPRVKALETHMEYVRRDLERLASVPADLATVKERVSHLPTKEYLVRLIIGALALIAALVTFGEKLQSLVR